MVSPVNGKVLMRNYVLLILLTCSLFWVNDASAKRKKHKKQADENSAVSVGVVYGPCYGHCAQFSIELNQDGVVTYTGKRYAEDSGSFTRKIDVNEAARILKLVQTYRMDTCQDGYHARIPDIQVFDCHIQYPKKEKFVRNAMFGPTYFKEIAAELNAVGAKKQFGDWVKQPSGEKK